MSVPGPPSKQAKWVCSYLSFSANRFMLGYCHAGMRESLTLYVEGGVGQGPRAQSGSVKDCLLCLGSWLQPSSLSYPPTLLSPFSTLSLAGPYAQNLKLISSCVDRSAISFLFSELELTRSDSAGVSESLWQWHPEEQGRRWRAHSVTLSPLLIVAVEWPGRTARSAPRPSMVSRCTVFVSSSYIFDLKMSLKNIYQCNNYYSRVQWVHLGVVH